MTYADRIRAAEKVVTRLSVERESYAGLCRRYDDERRKAADDIAVVEAANSVVQSVALELQDSVRTKVQSIVQTALDATFPGNVFLMEFVTRRDRTEVDMYISDAEGNKQSVLFGNGGGLKDVVSFALRVAVWSLDDGASDVIVLDEPMKFMSAGCRNQGAELLDVLSRDLGVQFIVVSHVPEIIENASRAYIVVQGADGISRTRLCEEKT